MQCTFNFTFLIGLSLTILLSLRGEVSCENLEVEEAAKDFSEKFSNGVNLDTWEAPEEMKLNLMYYHSGHDYEDRPIWIANWGKWDMKKYVDAGGQKLEDFNNYINQMALRAMQSLIDKSTEENVISEVVLIIDADGFNMEQINCYGFLIDKLNKYASWAPNTLRIEKIYIVYASFIAKAVINMIMPHMGKAAENCEVYGTNKAKWVPVLLKAMPNSQIPPKYGGIKSFKPIKVYG